nr:hypothetical protein [uncultured Helicobacter sp.]
MQEWIIAPQECEVAPSPLKIPHPYNAFIGLRFTRFNLTRLKIYFKRKSLRSLAPQNP